MWGPARHWPAVLVFALLAACSNGRGSLNEPASAPVGEAPPAQPPPETPPVPPPEPPSPPPQPPTEPPPSTSAVLAGYWKGSVIDEDERSREAVALIDALGNAQLWVLASNDSDEFVLYGNVCCAASFDSELTGRRRNGGREETVDFEAALDDGAIAGAFRFRRDDYTFRLQPAAEYDEALTLQGLAGVYTQTTTPLFGEPTTISLSIDADGTLSGSHSNGCVFNGTVTIPDTSHNMARLSVQLAGCTGDNSDWNGSYSGLGLLLRDAVSPSNPLLREDVFYHSLVGPIWLGPLSVGR